MEAPSPPAVSATAPPPVSCKAKLLLPDSPPIVNTPPALDEKASPPPAFTLTVLFCAVPLLPSCNTPAEIVVAPV